MHKTEETIAKHKISLPNVLCKLALRTPFLEQRRKYRYGARLPKLLVLLMYLRGAADHHCSPIVTMDKVAFCTIVLHHKCN